MLKEFKEFAIKGNAIDMAVGVIIGAAFGGIISVVSEGYHHATDQSADWWA